jgi:hypothetical protein
MFEGFLAHGDSPSGSSIRLVLALDARVAALLQSPLASIAVTSLLSSRSFTLFRLTPHLTPISFVVYWPVPGGERIFDVAL